MKQRIISALATLALLAGMSAAFPVGASAQQYPVYTTWQPQWDRYQYDRRHVILGTVVAFWPYRVRVARRNGMVQTIDLKNGTVIHPTGATPVRGDRIAIYGYYSNGTFVANGVVLR
ncbi:MAG TPA: hypothetical protein VMA98_10535 [Candidatus Acidoferrales bacterium]|nr:hypothetical protein [Candidatus Acidoferrales bacterium]